MRKLVVLAFVLPIAALAACGGNTYNVGSGQTYATYAAAFLALQADCPSGTPFVGSNTIHLYAGTYTEEAQTAVGFLFSNDAVNRLVISLDAGAIIDAQNTRPYAIYSGQPHVTVTGGTVQNSTIYALSGFGNDTIVSGVTALNSVSGCFVMTGLGTVVSGSTASNCGGAGISVANTGTGTCLIFGNISHDNTNGDGIAIGQPNCTVYGNSVYNNTLHGGITFQVVGGSAYGNFSNNNRYGFLLNNGAIGIVLYNNLSINSIFNFQTDNGGAGSIINNTTYGATNTEIRIGAPIDGPVVVENNAMYSTVAATVGFYSSSASITADNNALYQTGAAGIFTQINGVNYSTWAAEFAAVGLNQHSVSGNPLFVNAGGTTPASYEFTSGSPLQNAGLTPGGITTDYFGTTRPQGSAFDIGFFELIATANAARGALLGIQ